MFRLFQWLLTGACVLIASLITPAQQGTLAEQGTDKLETWATEFVFQATLDAQVTARNADDIPGFVAGHVNSTDLRFAS